MQPHLGYPDEIIYSSIPHSHTEVYAPLRSVASPSSNDAPFARGMAVPADPHSGAVSAKYEPKLAPQSVLFISNFAIIFHNYFGHRDVIDYTIRL